MTVIKLPTRFTTPEALDILILPQRTVPLPSEFSFSSLPLGFNHSRSPTTIPLFVLFRIRYTVPFRPIRLVIVIRGSACRIFRSCHRSSEVPAAELDVMSSVFSPPGDSVWANSVVAILGAARRAMLSPSSGPPPLKSALTFCHQPTLRRVGRNGTVFVLSFYAHF
jgi:hypothetical protein